MFTYRCLPVRPVVFDEDDDIIFKYKIGNGPFAWWMFGRNQMRDDMFNTIDEMIGGDGLVHDPHWRAMLKIYMRIPDGSVDGTGTATFDMSDARFDEEVEECTMLMRGIDFDEIHGDDEFLDENPSLRMILAWCMLHRLDILGVLIDRHIVHVGCMLFPKWNGHFHNDGCRQSLLGMAAIDCQSAAATKFLIERGADPNGCLNKHSCDVMGYVCGAEAVAQRDAAGDWREFVANCTVPSPSTALEVMQVLFDAGCDTFGARMAYSEKTHEQTAVFLAADAKRSGEIRQRWENVVAIVAIVSAWRRFAAAPDGAGGTRAVKRLRTMVA